MFVVKYILFFLVNFEKIEEKIEIWDSEKIQKCHEREFGEMNYWKIFEKNGNEPQFFNSFREKS